MRDYDCHVLVYIIEGHEQSVVSIFQTCFKNIAVTERIGEYFFSFQYHGKWFIFIGKQGHCRNTSQYNFEEHIPI